LRSQVGTDCCVEILCVFSTFLIGQAVRLLAKALLSTVTR